MYKSGILNNIYNAVTVKKSRLVEPNTLPIIINKIEHAFKLILLILIS